MHLCFFPSRDHPVPAHLLPLPQAYGLLNTLYYSCAFLFAWIYVAKVPAGQGAAAAAKAFAGERARRGLSRTVVAAR